MLKLEIFAAGRGDALLLHHGTSAAPRRMLIDGGASGTWVQALRPRLEQLGAGAELGQALPLELVMVSHLDDDHINGILALLRSEEARVDSSEPRTITPATIWVNVFEELATSSGSDAGSAAASAAELGGGALLPDGGESTAIVASISQGRDLRDVARKLRIPINRPFDDALVLAGQPPDPVSFGDIELTVLSPNQKRVDDLRKKWLAYLEARQKKDTASIAESAAFVDRSVFNLSSIVALVRQDQKTILLTGDARGDDILDGLNDAKLLKDGRIHVGILKVPHHGSARNVTQEFFGKVTADHYVICSDGTDDNPDDAMLTMLRNARHGESYHLWISYRRPRLVTFAADAHADGEVFEATFRDETQPSLVVDLG